jgi:hypothetical protein
MTKKSEPSVTLVFNLKDRIVAGSVLGSVKQAQFADWKLIEEWMDVLGLKNETYEEFGIEAHDNGTITWNEKEKADEERGYEVSPAAFELFKKKVLEQEKQQGVSKDLQSIAVKLGIVS